MLVDIMEDMAIIEDTDTMPIEVIFDAIEKINKDIEEINEAVVLKERRGESLTISFMLNHRTLLIF